MLPLYSPSMPIAGPSGPAVLSTSMQYRGLQCQGNETAQNKKNLFETGRRSGRISHSVGRW